jgi:hypothetical protein
MVDDGTAVCANMVGIHLRMDPKANRQVCDLHLVNSKVSRSEKKELNAS